MSDFEAVLVGAVVVYQYQLRRGERYLSKADLSKIDVEQAPVYDLCVGQ